MKRMDLRKRKRKNPKACQGRSEVEQKARCTNAFSDMKGRKSASQEERQEWQQDTDLVILLFLQGRGMQKVEAVGE